MSYTILKVSWEPDLTLVISFFITTGNRKYVLFFAGGEMAE